MIIVTPPALSVPEPRPQALITGDRAVVLLSDNGVTTSALVKAGVQIVTVSLSVYTELTTQLAQTTTDIDPNTGLIKETLLPARLSAGAIAALNLLGSDSHILEQYLPARLSPANLTALMSSSGGTSSSSATITTATIATANVSTLTVSGTAQIPSATISGSLEAGPTTLRNQSSAPATPAATKAVLYTDANSRLTLKDSSGQAFLIGNKRIVTSWPASADSQLGDEAINATTGEHRIYQGATKGWRLASPFSVTSLADRNAITAPYNGMRVYCDFGVPQDHVYDNGIWRGTKTFGVQGGWVRFNQNVNDTNFRRWNETPINDPGYPYLLSGRYSFEVVQQSNTMSRVEVWTTIVDQNTGANWQCIHQSYDDYWSGAGQNNNRFCHFDAAPMTGPGQVQTGNRTICIDWRLLYNNCNAYSGSYQAWNDWLVIPA